MQPLQRGRLKLKADIEAGRAVTPVGKNAEQAGLKAGEPIKIDTHKIERPEVK